MEGIRQSLYSMFVVCACASVIIMLSPDRDDGVKKYIRYLCGLCVCMCLVYPLRECITWITQFQNLPNGDITVSETYSYEEMAISACKDELEREVESLLYERFGQKMTVTVFLESHDTQAVKITSVCLYGKAQTDSQKQEMITAVESWLGLSGNVTLEDRS